MIESATDHLRGLLARDRVLYGRACAIVDLAAQAWRCSMDHLLSAERSPQIDSVRAALTLVIREQTALSLDDIARVVARDDHSTIQHRVRQANAAMMRRAEPIFSAYWSLIGYMRGRFPLQGRHAFGTSDHEDRRLDLRPYLTRPEGVLTASRIRVGVAEALGFELADLGKRGGPPEHRDARIIAAALMRGELGFSFPQIARAMQLRSHTSIVTFCHRFEDLMTRVEAQADDRADDSGDDRADQLREHFRVCCAHLAIDPGQYPAKLRDCSLAPCSAPKVRREAS